MRGLVSNEFFLGNIRYFNPSTANPVFFANADAFELSIIAEGRIAARQFDAYSDRRIKDVVGLSDGQSDLETIRRLRVTDYRMIDERGRRVKVHKGFIAQEVEELVPESVSKMRSFVPDIFSIATEVHYERETKRLRVTLGKAHGLKSGDRVRLHPETGDQGLELAVAEVPAANAFVVAGVNTEPKRVFVYGREVADFRSLDYDHLFTTGVSAIQELARRMESMEKREAQVAQRLEKVEQRETRVAELERKADRVTTLESEVAELQKLVRQIATATKTVRQVSSKD